MSNETLVDDRRRALVATWRDEMNADFTALSVRTFLKRCGALCDVEIGMDEVQVAECCAKFERYGCTEMLHCVAKNGFAGVLYGLQEVEMIESEKLREMMQ